MINGANPGGLIFNMKRYIKANREAWDSARVIDLVWYYLGKDNMSIDDLARLIIKQMKDEGSKLPHNIHNFYDALYSAIDEYNEQYSDEI